MFGSLTQFKKIDVINVRKYGCKIFSQRMQIFLNFLNALHTFYLLQKSKKKTTRRKMIRVIFLFVFSTKRFWMNFQGNCSCFLLSAVLILLTKIKLKKARAFSFGRNNNNKQHC